MKPSYIHTNFFNYFLKKRSADPKNINKKNVFDFMLNDLEQISQRKIIIPTFNYDFGKNKIYNVQKDKSQVGSFSEFFRKKFILNRSSIPVFSSCSNYKVYPKKKVAKDIDVFGPESDFAYLTKHNGNIINFEVEFAPTFIIYIERFISKKIIYRYFKKINGKIVDGKIKKNISAHLFVRPKKININYDLLKIKKDLKKSGILKLKKFKLFNYEVYNSNDLFDFCISKINKDYLYFLDKDSKLNLHNKRISLKNKKNIELFD